MFDWFKSPIKLLKSLELMRYGIFNSKSRMILKFKDPDEFRYGSLSLERFSNTGTWFFSICDIETVVGDKSGQNVFLEFISLQ